MTHLVWGGLRERTFETGADRGVLYPETGPGVAWNGLIGVDQKSTNTAPAAYYMDGIKYYNEGGLGDFEATIEAFTYPVEFELCDGSAQLDDGIGALVTQQPRQSFSFCYRTLIGDASSGVERGYKLHLIYNAMASPSDRTYSTLADSPEAATFTWDLSTTPKEIPGFRPSAHIVVDSTKTPPFAMAVLEGILYGLNDDPRMPEPWEVIELPWATRMIRVISSPESIPADAQEGDVFFATSDQGLYSYGEPSEDTRPIVIMSSEDTLPEGTYNGDMIYQESSGNLYQVESTQSGQLRFIADLTGPIGPPGSRGEQGLPGVNAVPADEAVGAYVDSENSITRAAITRLINAREIPDLSITETKLANFSVSASKMRSSKHIIH